MHMRKKVLNTTSFEHGSHAINISYHRNFTSKCTITVSKFDTDIILKDLTKILKFAFTTKFEV